jgi:hypothetical protein
MSVFCGNELGLFWVDCLGRRFSVNRDLKDFAALLTFAAFADVFRPHGELFATLGAGRPMGRGGACHIDGLQGD